MTSHDIRIHEKASCNQPHCLASCPITTNHITSSHLAANDMTSYHITSQHTTSPPRKQTSHPPQLPPPDGTFETSCTQKNSGWALHRLVALRTFYSQFFWGFEGFFPLWNFRPRLAWALLVEFFNSSTKIWLQV